MALTKADAAETEDDEERGKTPRQHMLTIHLQMRVNESNWISLFIMDFIHFSYCFRIHFVCDFGTRPVSRCV